MITTQTNNFEDLLLETVQKVISQRIEKASREAIEEAKNQVEAKLAEIVAGIAVKLVSEISLERMCNEILIHVKMPK